MMLKNNVETNIPKYELNSEFYELIELIELHSYFDPDDPET